ncbi:hypothetical protein V6N12_056081 [Hibiscus sabdariffa]|uniref:Uncharacterized protein n=1 Tax=Hibiscus sabdariffa TaxID=183260 RepID=A0ABR2CRG8_9ROSI
MAFLNSDRRAECVLKLSIPVGKNLINGYGAGRERRQRYKRVRAVLRIPITALLVDKVSSGSSLARPPLQAKLPFFSQLDDGGKIARGICITMTSLKPAMSNFLVVYPPRCTSPNS